MRTSEFDYRLPPGLIAQNPTTERDASRLLVLDRQSNQVSHHRFKDLTGFLKPGDLLVLNNSRVIPARLRGVNPQTGGAFEMLLLEEASVNEWWTMMKPARRARTGALIRITSDIIAEVIAENAEGHRLLKFSCAENIRDQLDAIGETPLPPYITRNGDANDSLDRERYQTIYAQPPGSVAAPTAGLHFTEELFAALKRLGVEIHFVTLHVGLGTFAPVKSETIESHPMHEEHYEISQATAHAVNTAKASGRRVVAVGTTSVRVLESSAATHNGKLQAESARTRIFIRPPFTFRIVDALITNFHLPCSTLLMLASAFAAPGELRGRQMILDAYAEAIKERYRFFSYGDAMFIA